MKTYIFDLINKAKRTSDSLDAKAILCNKTWRVFSDSGEKEVYIFMEDGKLVISVNGVVTMGTWMYIPANQSLVISGNNQNFLVHPIICNNVLILALDGSNQCSFLLDSTKAELDRIQSLTSIESYISENANKKPTLTNGEGEKIRFVIIQEPIPSNAIYASDPRLKYFFLQIWNDEHTKNHYEHRLYIKGLFSYKLFSGTIYTSRHNFVYEFRDGIKLRTSMYFPNKQLAVEIVNRNDDDNGIYLYDEEGYELTEEAFDAKYDNYYEKLYEREGSEIDNIENGGNKDA